MMGYPIPSTKQNEGKDQKDTPTIINEINEYLGEDFREDGENSQWRHAKEFGLSLRPELRWILMSTQ